MIVRSNICKKTIYILGNPLVAQDNLAVKLLPILSKNFADFDFQYLDPTEDMPKPCNDELILIDTVSGIDKVTLFCDIENFSLSPHVSVHDYDLTIELKLLKKIGVLKKVKIIGIPIKSNKKEIIDNVVKILKSIVKNST